MVESSPEEKAEWQAPLTDAELEASGMRTVLSGGKLFCGVTQEEFAIGGVTYAWARGSKIKWGIAFTRLGPLSAMDVKDAITAALKEISDCCDFKHEYVANADFANIYMIAQRLDGPSGVLADCEIPSVGARPESTRLRLRFDDGEHWVLAENPGGGQIDLYRVALHELEHGHGLGHKPDNIAARALIAPIYSQTIRNLQPADIGELQRRYGPSQVQPPLPPVTPPLGDSLGVDLIINAAGKKYRATGNAKRVS